MMNEGVFMWAWNESANGEEGDAKYSSAWDASLYLTPADKMCDNQNNRYATKQKGSAAFLAKE
eukprot:scaffold145997_cov35-Attheya_sp.AAC.1